VTDAACCCALKKRARETEADFEEDDTASRYLQFCPTVKTRWQPFCVGGGIRQQRELRIKDCWTSGGLDYNWLDTLNHRD
jgi:hypothetical protein